jgi:YVTN family beta-propeller protein
MSYRHFFALLLSFSFFAANLLAIPVITSVNPAVGPTVGGTAVAISGSGFTGATAVTFGTSAAASFIVNSDSSITAVTPTHSPQVVTIFVTAPSGTSVISDTSFFTFQGDWQAYVIGGPVSVIDVNKLIVTTTIPDVFASISVDILPDGSLAYFADDNLTIPVVDTATNTIINSIPLPFLTANVSTLGMTPNGAQNYAPARNDNVVVVVDNATETAPFPYVTVGTGPRNVAITPDSSQAYVLNEDDGTVSVINTATSTVTATITVGETPLSASATPDGKQVYVLNFDGASVSVINTATNTVTTTIAVGINPRAIAITPDGTKAYVANATDGTVSVIDTSTNTVTGTITVGADPSVVSITPDGTQVYVINTDDDTVSVISTASGTVTATVTVGIFPQTQAISPDGKNVFVVNDSVPGIVSVIDTTSNTVVASLTVVDEPSGIAITADQAPLAQFTITVQPVGQPTIFNASNSNSPTGTIANYSWNFGDGSPIVNTTNPVITHVYNAPGTYTVILVVTNTAGTSLTQILYFSSSAPLSAEVASPVTNNNGGPTAMRVHSFTIGVAPPSNFIGCVKTNQFLNKTEFILFASFTASSSPDVLFYQIFENGVLVKQIPATAALNFEICLRSKQLANLFSVIAVGTGGVSTPVPITIVGSCCSLQGLFR